MNIKEVRAILKGKTIKQLNIDGHEDIDRKLLWSDLGVDGLEKIVEDETYGDYILFTGGTVCTKEVGVCGEYEWRSYPFNYSYFINHIKTLEVKGKTAYITFK